MLRAVVSILLILPMLMPQGVCLREFNFVGCFARTKQPAHAPNGNAELTAKRPATACGCGHRERTDLACEAENVCSSGSDTSALVVADQPGPNDQTPEPCPAAICKAKLDKLVQHDHPQAGEETAASFAFVLVTPPQALPPVHSRSAAAFTSPPRYVTFCSFLI